VVLEKRVEDSWTDLVGNGSVSESQGGEQSPTKDENIECQLDLPHLA
jgi:hypothetical protein